MKIRLDKYLADMGKGTRSEVKKAIREKGKQMHPTYSFGLKNIGAILSETPRENLIAV